MKVTPKFRKFGKYNLGDIFELPDRPAKALILMKKVTEVIDDRSLTYQTRDMRAQRSPLVASVEVDSEGAAWDASIHSANKLKKADGTWRKRAGRVAGQSED